MFKIIRTIGAATRSIQTVSNETFKPLGLNNNLFIYLIRTVEQPGMFLGELADSLQIDRTTSFRTVQKLVKLGYLELKNDQQNLKIKRVFPTTKAKELYPQLHDYEQQSSDVLLKNLSTTERNQLAKLLDKLNI
ncbi:MarR family winged helix-turn-helix transcriptional regulator [Paucilactobacillus nenjiangensis]|jgi:DNA-binding MarR family transcriptional regulator|uniref:Winged helix-turn-helix transcriptional regulator n=1 Tax=Paucilactobacillus nenjiangensis TaxID=1296540 RepID=A0A5P1WYC7_9LACO|nr:MarR family winged helix-turn-helix transcriptional regulator [Paucilactobacillus nenjiangensis]QER66662.1 winged helix-turn-helix transcriptional regulator [Paucilactobacillus nenjiangensis]